MWERLESFFFFFWQLHGRWTLLTLLLGNGIFWSERFLPCEERQSEREREHVTQQPQEGRQKLVLCKNVSWSASKICTCENKVCVRERSRAVCCPSGQPWVLPDLSASVKPFPLQGCLAPPPHCVATRCRWTLSLFVERGSFQIIYIAQGQVTHLCACWTMWHPS